MVSRSRSESGSEPESVGCIVSAIHGTENASGGPAAGRGCPEYAGPPLARRPPEASVRAIRALGQSGSDYIQSPSPPSLEPRTRAQQQGITIWSNAEKPETRSA